MKKLLLTILTGTLLPLIGAELDYGVSVGYIYDSNIGQNINEFGKGYVVPDGFIKLKGTKVPLFGKVAVVYDNYLEERSPLLNSPFLSVSTGTEIRKEKFSYDGIVKGALFYGKSADSGFVPVKNSARLINDFSWKIAKHHQVELNTEMQANDYATTASDAFRLTVDPVYQYKFSVKKSEKVKFRSVSLCPEYEGNFAVSESESYTTGGVAIGSELKLWRTSLETSAGWASKKYKGTSAVTSTGDAESVHSTYLTIDGGYTVPIVSDLSFKVDGKLRFKNSNSASSDYDRHTIGAKLAWNSSVGRK